MTSVAFLVLTAVVAGVAAVENVTTLNLEEKHAWRPLVVLWVITVSTVAQAEGGVQAPKYVLQEQEAGNDGNRTCFGVWTTGDQYSVHCDYPQSLILKMASKRRNMFYENKKQGTTEIGEICKTKGDRQWVCKQQKDCLHIRGQPAPVCSFIGKEPVVCCPPDRPPRSVPSKITKNKRKCAKKCDAFAEMCAAEERDTLIWDGESPEGPLAGLGGRLSRAMAHPHMVLIGYGEEKEWHCGGSLISDNFVLSAAHCHKHDTLGPAKWVRLGDLEFNKANTLVNPEDVRISQTIVHPEYRPPALYNDIALYRLEKTVSYSLWVKPACVHSMPKIPFKKATACGWHGEGFANNDTPQLKDVELSLAFGAECQQLAKKIGAQMLDQGFKQQKMVCASTKGNGENCTTNSGGPLAVKMSGQCLWTVVGVKAYGGDCSVRNSPTIYTRVSHYTPWIEDIVWP